mgnify:CR=1 FL=1
MDSLSQHCIFSSPSIHLAGTPLYYGVCQTALIPLYVLLCWRLGWTYAPPTDPIWRVLRDSYQERGLRAAIPLLAAAPCPMRVCTYTYSIPKGVLAGLGADAGLAASIAFGLAALISALPGAFFLQRRTSNAAPAGDGIATTHD